MAEDRLLAWCKLRKGVHRLSFRCAGRNPSSAGFGLGLDTPILARGGGRFPGGGDPACRRAGCGDARATARRTRQSGPRGARSRGMGLHAAAVDGSGICGRVARRAGRFQCRGARVGGRAFRNCGPCAEAAFPELIARLRDSDENVRIAAADAIAKVGPKAAAAVPALIELGRANEHPHVLRSVSAALGAIGPAAADAVPVLEQVRRHIRVRWAAEAAIAAVKGEPLTEGPEPGGVRLQ